MILSNCKGFLKNSHRQSAQKSWKNFSAKTRLPGAWKCLADACNFRENVITCCTLANRFDRRAAAWAREGTCSVGLAIRLLTNARLPRLPSADGERCCAPAFTGRRRQGLRPGRVRRGGLPCQAGRKPRLWRTAYKLSHHIWRCIYTWHALQASTCPGKSALRSA